MTLTCGSCKAEYTLDASQVPAEGGVFACKTCGTEIEIPASGAVDIAIPLGDDDFSANIAPAADVATIDALLGDTTIPLGDDLLVAEVPLEAAPVQSPPPAPAARHTDETPTTVVRTPVISAPGKTKSAPVNAGPAIPAPVVPAVPDFLTDLPAVASHSTPSNDDALDLPAVASDEPSDLPASAAADIDITMDAEPITASSEPATPALMDSLELDSAAPGSAPTPEVSQDVELDSEPAPPAPPDSTISAPAPKIAARKRTTIVAAVGFVVVAGAAAVALVGPQFGLNLMEEPAPPPAPAPVPTKTEPKAPVAVEEKPPAPAPTPTLSLENVDTLGYRALKEATAAAADKNAGLVLWANYRLATMGDAEALAKLGTYKPADILAQQDEPTIAAMVGAAALNSKTPAIRVLGEKLLATKFKNSARLHWVVGGLYNKPVELPKALRHFEAALVLAPKMRDAAMAKFRISLNAKPTKAANPAATAPQELAAFVAKDSDARERLMAMGMLSAVLQQTPGTSALMETVVAGLSTNDQGEVPTAQIDDLYRWLVRTHLRAGNLALAITTAEKRLELSPASASALLELARLRRARGDGNVKDFLVQQRTGATDPTLQAQLALEEIHLALAAKDFNAAWALINELKLPPRSPGLAYLSLARGLAARDEGRMALAKQNLAAAAKGGLSEATFYLLEMTSGKTPTYSTKLAQLGSKATSGAILWAWGQTALAGREYAAAERALDAMLWLDPTSAPAKESFGLWLSALEKSGHGDLAMARLEKLYAADPKNAETLALLAGLAERTGDFAALEKWRKAQLDADPKSASQRLAYARALSLNKKGPAAEKLLHSWAQQNPEVKTPAFLVEQAYAWEVRDVSKARNYLKEAISKEPSGANYRELARFEGAQNRRDEAIEAYTQAAKLMPEDTTVGLALARLLGARGQLGRAKEILLSVVKADPKNADAQELLGDILLDSNDAKGAHVAYIAASNEGDPAEVLMKLARVQLQNLNMTPAGLKTLKRVIKTTPDNAEAHYYLGLVLKDQGKGAEAKSEFQTYLKLAPEGEFAADATRFIEDVSR